MGASVAKAGPSSPLNSIELRPAKASIDLKLPLDPPETAQVTDPVSLVFDTLASVGIQDKEAAYQMGLDPAQLSRIKSGQGRLSLESLWRLDDRFWAAFRRRIDDAKQLTDQRASELRAERIGELVSLLIRQVTA